MSNKKAKARYPIREYLGSFERYILVMRGRSVFRHYDRTLERLFSMFPKHTGCEQFISTDISDYKIAREQKGIKPHQLQLELFAIYKFWHWLTVDKNLPIWNPAKAFRNIELGVRKRVNQDLCLADINRLLSECPAVKDKQAILAIVQGGKCPRGKTRRTILEAATRAGLIGFTFSKLKTMLRTRLAHDIVQAYCDQIRKTFPLEPKLPGNSLTAIQLSTLDVGTSVGYNGNDFQPVSWVYQQEPSSEGQSPMSDCETKGVELPPVRH